MQLVTVDRTSKKVFAVFIRSSAEFVDLTPSTGTASRKTLSTTTQSPQVLLSSSIMLFYLVAALQLNIVKALFVVSNGTPTSELTKLKCIAT